MQRHPTPPSPPHTHRYVIDFPRLFLGYPFLLFCDKTQTEELFFCLGRCRSSSSSLDEDGSCRSEHGHARRVGVRRTLDGRAWSATGPTHQVADPSGRPIRMTPATFPPPDQCRLASLANSKPKARTSDLCELPRQNGAASKISNSSSRSAAGRHGSRWILEWHGCVVDCRIGGSGDSCLG